MGVARWMLEWEWTEVGINWLKESSKYESYGSPRPGMPVNKNEHSRFWVSLVENNCVQKHGRSTNMIIERVRKLWSSCVVDNISEQDIVTVKLREDEVMMGRTALAQRPERIQRGSSRDYTRYSMETVVTTNVPGAGRRQYEYQWTAFGVKKLEE